MVDNSGGGPEALESKDPLASPESVQELELLSGLQGILRLGRRTVSLRMTGDRERLAQDYSGASTLFHDGKAKCRRIL